jgi:hypothetical protein
VLPTPDIRNEYEFYQYTLCADGLIAAGVQTQYLNLTPVAYVSESP